jgi:predicted TPR repeat methyltransferase
MSHERVNYESLKCEYSDPFSLQFKKLRLVDRYIPEGKFLLDIGAGTGEFIKLEISKFGEIYGIDADNESLGILADRFKTQKNVHIIESDSKNLNIIFPRNKFDCVTCLDILEHIELHECKIVLKQIYEITNDFGLFVFTGPGIFAKFKISIGSSPGHLHSHSSYGWARLINESGFDIISVESVEFPLIDNVFLRKNVHILGKCCVIISQKKSIKRLK